MRINTQGEIEVFNNDKCIDCTHKNCECPLILAFVTETAVPMRANTIVKDCALHLPEELVNDLDKLANQKRTKQAALS